jgi:hypothetical protein
VRELLVGAEVSNGLRVEQSARVKTLSTVEGAAD